MKRWLLLLLIIAAALVVVPVWLIQPFKPQTERALSVGYEVKRLAPWATIALALVGLVLVARMWRASRRWWAKALMVLLLAPVLASVWAARQNVYELMFSPLAAPAYARAEEADFVGDDEMVLAVERGGERVAYPVRLMAYHHLVADTVGGVPLVATY
jgi:small-conductance mechanosensitive channel